MMLKQKLRIEPSVKAGGLILITISEVAFFSHTQSSATSFLGYKKPKALVAIGPEGPKVLNLDGEIEKLETMMEKVPGLKETLAEISWPSQKTDTTSLQR